MIQLTCNVEYFQTIMIYENNQNVSSFKLVTSDIVSMTTSMLEFINDELFLFNDYIILYINDFQSFHMSNISFTC